MADEVPMIVCWQGRPITDFSREELIEALTDLVPNYLSLLKVHFDLKASIFRT